MASRWEEEEAGEEDGKGKGPCKVTHGKAHPGGISPPQRHPQRGWCRACEVQHPERTKATAQPVQSDEEVPGTHCVTAHEN